MIKKPPSQFLMDCKDHSVSGEQFQLYRDEEYDMLITTPKPDFTILSKYYASEDYISHTDAKRTFFEKAYHVVKGYALNNKRRLVTKLNKGSGKILDIGAGTGDFLVYAKKAGWIVEGAEPNIEAKELAKEKGISLENNTENYEANNFDVITMWHVLEHVYDLEAQLKELKRLLKPNGHVIIAVPNFKSYDAQYYKSFWAGYDVPRHLWHFSESAIEKLFENHDLVLQKTLPMIFDAFYVSLLSEKYKTGKMNFLKAFFIGLQSNIKAIRSKQYSSHIYILKNSNS